MTRPSPRPRVDVGIVTWNTGDLTVSSVRRLLDTDQGADLRVLVRDNGSTDGTAETLAGGAPEAELDVDPRNLGFAAGMNRLLERSDAPWFLALNSDAWPDPGAVGRLVATGRQWPRAGAVAPRLLRPDGTLEHSTHAFPSLGLAAAAAVGPALVGRRVGDALLLQGAWDHGRPRAVGWAVGAALLMRRAAVDEIGGFDERFFMYAEDLEWCWRARQAGWSVRFEPDAVVRHIGNVSGARAYGAERGAVIARNAYRFYRGTHGWGPTAAWRALHLAGAARLWMQCRVAGDLDAAAFWREQMKLHLAKGESAVQLEPGPERPEQRGTTRP